MKANVTIQHVAGVAGYEKIFFQFVKPKTGLERLLVSEFGMKRYIGGKEPKVSLYVGAPEERIIEGDVARQWTPSYKKFSWQRFWKELRAQNPAYQFECRCGLWTKSDKTYREHKKDCATMREFKVFLARIENSQIYQDALDAQRKSSRKTKQAKTATKRNKQRRTSTAKKATKTVAIRSARKHK